MELGQRLKAARLEAGLSQRQLCGDVITRNMLSQIENGSARPSMATLRCLSERLGKTVSYFLEEEAVTSPNQALMALGRAAYQQKDYELAARTLGGYQAPDETFDWEWALLSALADMGRAEQAIREDRLRFAAELLDRAGQIGPQSPYYTPALERERMLLLVQARPREARLLAVALGHDDRELLLRAQAALVEKDPAQCGIFLAAARDKEAPLWCWLRGEAYRMEKEWGPAARCYHKAEEAMPQETAPRLEQCYRELEDFRRAYEYALKQK